MEVIDHVAHPALHFVGFRDDRYWSAAGIWGRPDFIHPDWDRWAAQEVAPGDTVVFAKGDAGQAPRPSGRPPPTGDRAAGAPNT